MRFGGDMVDAQGRCLHMGCKSVGESLLWEIMDQRSGAISEVVGIC
jgi:hypothetical protein